MADDAAFAVLRLVFFSKTPPRRRTPTWAMYFLTSSAVMPMPLSEKASVPSSALATTSMRQGSSPSPSAVFGLAHGDEALHLAHRVAAVGNHFPHKYILVGIQPFLMTGMMFSALMEIVPFSAMLIASIILVA